MDKLVRKRIPVVGFLIGKYYRGMERRQLQASDYIVAISRRRPQAQGRSRHRQPNGRQGRAYAEQHFTISSIGDRFEALLTASLSS